MIEVAWWLPYVIYGAIAIWLVHELGVYLNWWSRSRRR